MAREKSILMLQGNIGNFSFYKTKDGSMVRMKGGVERSRILNDPKFARTRENMNEFALLAATGKTIRSALSNYIRKTSDSRASNRMTSLLSQIKHLDVAAKRGERTPVTGLGTPEGKQILEGFDFNSNSQMRTLLTSPYSFNPATGVMTVNDFAPATRLLLPKEATHVQFGIAAAGFDEEFKFFETVYSVPTILPIAAAPATLNLDPGGSPAVADMVVYCVLIEFLQEINGEQYPLKNNLYNCLNVVRVV